MKKNKNISSFITKKFKNLNSCLENDCSKLTFEVYYVFVAQKLKISGFLIKLFFSWTLTASAAS